MLFFLWCRPLSSLAGAGQGGNAGTELASEEAQTAIPITPAHTQTAVRNKEVASGRISCYLFKKRCYHSRGQNVASGAAAGPFRWPAGNEG